VKTFPFLSVSFLLWGKKNQKMMLLHGSKSRWWLARLEDAPVSVERRWSPRLFFCVLLLHGTARPERNGPCCCCFSQSVAAFYLRPCLLQKNFTPFDSVSLQL